MRIRP
jgi:pyruvate/2-oxoglutarate dehydrogenase complex dihydrolipoamide dehydrogenase (E3) component